MKALLLLALAFSPLTVFADCPNGYTQKIEDRSRISSVSDQRNFSQCVNYNFDYYIFNFIETIETEHYMVEVCTKVFSPRIENLIESSFKTSTTNRINSMRFSTGNGSTRNANACIAARNSMAGLTEIEEEE